MVAAIAPAPGTEQTDSVFQLSVIRATVEGLYDGVMTFAELKDHGDFGIGTSEGLDGELVVLDGKFYQLKADGSALEAEDQIKTPLATVTFFDPDCSFVIQEQANFSRLQEIIDRQLTTKNIFYAVRVDGDFDYIKTRSVPAQEKPYPPLVEAVKGQTTMDFFSLNGTIVGFRYPEFAEGLGFPGYHLHFINEERSGGGHLLDCMVKNATITIDEIWGLEMMLPQDQEFYRADLSEKKKEELERAESNPD